MRTRIRLDTMQDINSFVAMASRIDAKVSLEDGKGNRVNAASVLGAMLAKMEWDEIYCFCPKDISASLMPWLVFES